MKDTQPKDPRLAVLASRLGGLQTVAAAAREDAAIKRFRLDDVSEAMSVAASSGFDTLTIAPSAALDLRNTPTAVDTTTMLKAAGFEVAWEKRQPRPDEPEMWVLTVSWRPKP